MFNNNESNVIGYNGNYKHKKIIATSGINFNNNLGIKWNRFNQYAMDTRNIIKEK